MVKEMQMKTKYRLISKSDNRVDFRSSAYDTAMYLNGLRLDDMLVIKSDERGDRLVNFYNAKNFEELAAVIKEA